MKKLIENYLLLILIISIITCCEKEKKALVPIVTTKSISNIAAVSANSGGDVTSDGGATVTTRGVCWSTGITPTISDSKTTDGAGAGSFPSNLTGLNGATNYYVRAYATNSVGTSYGMAVAFTTLGQAPTQTNASATNVTATSATINGSVNANYFSTVVTFEYGISTSYGNIATAIQSPVSGNINTNVSANITGLTALTIYHFRIKSVNSLGTTYGSDMTFTTIGNVPNASTTDVQGLTTEAAELYGLVNANYLSTNVTFEYGTTTNYGSSITAPQSPVTGNTNTNINVILTGLTAGTTYHFRIKAVNSLGTTYGNNLTFKTLGQVPIITTSAVTNITLAGAQLNGYVSVNYLSTTVAFEYGLTTSYGNIVNSTQSPITGNGDSNVSAILIGLTEGKTYHYRIVATNTLGTTYSNDMTFTTLGQVPTISTKPANNITITGAQLNGTVNANYLESSVTFEYGTSISYGNTATAIQSPAVGNEIINVNTNITGLVEGTTYHFRVSATNSLGTSYGDDVTFKAAHTIGGSELGGIIFYIDETGQHGLVCALVDQSTGADWGCLGTSITGADGISNGTGNQNTTDIINGCLSGEFAAKICYNLDLNGYTDWFLPSKNELGLIWQNIKSKGLGGISLNPYWSSSEYTAYEAWGLDFNTGTYTIYAKSNPNPIYVRAIRAF